MRITNIPADNHQAVPATVHTTRLSSLHAASAPLAPVPSFRFTAGEARVFRPRDRHPRTGLPLTVSQWADIHRVVTEGGRRGPWSTDFAAYTREPMDVWTLPYVRRIILCWSPQSSKTQVALNCAAYAVDQDPGPIMWVACDEAKSVDTVNKKIKPLVRSCPRLAEIVTDIDRDITQRIARFANGVEWQIVWATSPAQLASESIRYLIRDETDKYPDFSGREADPMSLAEQRVTAYPYTYKILDCSTPGFDSGIISTAMRFDADEIRDYHVPCPICGVEQRMEFEFITWPQDIKDWRAIRRNKLAHYSCRACGMKWDDRLRNEAVRRGRWIARTPCTSGRPETIAYHLPAWYSPMVSLSRCAAAYLQAREDPAKDMAFVTQIRAEGYSETIEKKEEAAVLARHRVPELPAQVVPAAAIALTAGIDSHKTYYKYVVRAHAADRTSWLIDYGVLSAATDADLEQLIFHTRYPIQGRDDGATMGIWRAAIDSGGGQKPMDEITENITDRVYEFAHKHRSRATVYATKGASHRQLKRVHKSTIGTASVTPRGTVPKWARFHTLELHILDVDRFKLLIHGYLEAPADADAPPVQGFWLHQDVGLDYARELLGEELRRDRKGRTFWQQVRANHYLDCEVLCAACADAEWLPSLKMQAAYLARQAAAAATPPPVPPTDTGFINKYRQARTGGFVGGFRR